MNPLTTPVAQTRIKKEPQTIACQYFKKKKTAALTGGPSFSSTAWVNVNCGSREQAIRKLRDCLPAVSSIVGETRKKEACTDELCDSGHTS